MFDSEPLSIVLLQPISTSLPIMTEPICGYLIFLFLPGKKPKPFFPIIAPSKMFVLLPTIEFFNITLLPILQLLPILTFDSIIELLPIEQLIPIFTFLPTRTFLPTLSLENFFLSIDVTKSSKLSSSFWIK